MMNRTKISIILLQVAILLFIAVFTLVVLAIKGKFTEFIIYYIIFSLFSVLIIIGFNWPPSLHTLHLYLLIVLFWPIIDFSILFSILNQRKSATKYQAIHTFESEYHQKYCIPANEDTGERKRLDEEIEQIEDEMAELKNLRFDIVSATDKLPVLKKGISPAEVEMAVENCLKMLKIAQAFNDARLLQSLAEHIKKFPILAEHVQGPLNKAQQQMKLRKDQSIKN